MKKNYLLLFVFLTAFSMLQSGFAQTPVMNEIYSRGVSGNLDWIEIYNPSLTPIDISDYKIYDSGGQSGSKPKKLFPSGTIIPAQGFYVIITDTADFDGDLSGFGLSSSGEEVWLENASGTVIDNVTFPAMAVTESYGRIPDGATWQLLSTITRGASNIVIEVNYTLMNELFSRGTTAEPDWIEIYNSSDTEKDISGYKIYDSGGQAGTKPKKEFPLGSTIPANGYLVIIVDDADPSGFGLSSSGEWVWFENASGTVVDSINLVAVTDTAASYGRLPDGSDNWEILVPRTRGFSNVPVTTSSVLINELFSRGTAAELDWIEIYNPTSSSVDITGYKIYDSGGQSGSKPKKEFPAGSVIPANGFLVIITDDTDPSGFGLSSSGEWVWFENTSGTVIDSINLVAVTDTAASYGRLPDGNANWQILVPRTRGYSNVFTDVEDNFNSINEYRLNQNYPNPFNPTTTISFTIPASGNVSLKVFNILGKEVATLVNETKSAGNYSVDFNAAGLSSGVYFYQLTTDNFTATKKFTLMK
jgi:predicted extracellular nuclease